MSWTFFIDLSSNIFFCCSNQAGIFRHGGAATAEGEGGSTSNMEVEEGEEGSTIGGERVEEISSEYSGPTKSKSMDEFEGDEDDEGEDDEGDGDGDNKNKKKRKKYHRHTSEQIRVMEACV